MHSVVPGQVELEIVLGVKTLAGSNPASSAVRRTNADHCHSGDRRADHRVSAQFGSQLVSHLVPERFRHFATMARARTATEAGRDTPAATWALPVGSPRIARRKPMRGTAPSMKDLWEELSQQGDARDE